MATENMVRDDTLSLAVQQRNLLEVLGGMIRSTGSVAIAAGNVSAGNTITISDGKTSNIFEFYTTTYTAGHIPVKVGGTATVSMTNLVAAINANGIWTLDRTRNEDPIRINATAAGTSCTLLNTCPGVAGNVAITSVGVNITTTGMTNGANAGSIPVTVEVGDVEIGKVKLLDGGGTNVANITAANTARSTGTLVLCVQPIDAAGNIISGGSGGLTNSQLRATAVPVSVSSGNPVLGTSATGADGYVTVVTAPARVCNFLHVAVGNNGAIISLDGGTTDHFAIPANVERGFGGLEIASGATINAKNLTAGSNYTNLYISVW